MFKKSLSIIMAILTMFLCFSVSAFAADVNVKLRVEGPDKCYFYETVLLSEKSTVFDVLLKADKSSEDFFVDYYYDNEYKTNYLTAINGVYAGTYTVKAWDGWSFTVNGVAPSVGMSQVEVKAGDSIIVYYGDDWVTGMQFPKADFSKLDEGKVSFTSTETEYDTDWNATTVEKAVTGYTLIWGYEGKTISLTPDENGVCTIPENYLMAGEHSVQIERTAKTDKGMTIPTVLRFAPDFTVTVENKTEVENKSFFDKLRDFFQMIIDFFKSLFTR